MLTAHARRDVFPVGAVLEVDVLADAERRHVSGAYIYGLRSSSTRSQSSAERVGGGEDAEEEEVEVEDGHVFSSWGIG